MSWLDDDYTRRAAISVATSGSTADVDVVIPSDWDDFWDEIDANGYGVRVTLADGRTAVPYAVDNGSGGAFDRSGRLGRVRIDGATFRSTAGLCSLLWLYYGIETPTSGAAAVTMGSPLTGRIEQAQPHRPILAQPLRPGLATPRDAVAKTPTEETVVWVDVTGLLERRRTDTAGLDHLEEPWAALPAGYDDTGTTAAIVEATRHRWVELDSERGRRIYLRVGLTGGTDGEVYTVRVPISTIAPEAAPEQRRAIEVAFAVRVTAPLES